MCDSLRLTPNVGIQMFSSASVRRWLQKHFPVVILYNECYRTERIPSLYFTRIAQRQSVKATCWGTKDWSSITCRVRSLCATASKTNVGIYRPQVQRIPGALFLLFN